ncbi:MAG: hypothetical protein ACPGYY_00040 [Bacteroidia bacterium]
MNIFSKCSKCSAELKSTTTHYTRLEHAMRKGEYVEQRCTICNHDNKHLIDEYKTKPSKSLRKIALVALVVGLVISVLVFLWLLKTKEVILVAYGMFGIPFFVYGSIVKYDQSRVNNFNSLFVKC